MLRIALAWFLCASVAVGLSLPDKCTVFSKSQSECNPVAPASFLPAFLDDAPKSKTRSEHSGGSNLFADLVNALNVTQSEFFAPWLGTWPDAIDWTAAVIGTHVSGVTRSISQDSILINSNDHNAVDWRWTSNLVDKYFTQLVGYYFGQDAFAIRNEAYDDILWVVLGWLETIKLVNAHDELYFTPVNANLSQASPGSADGATDGTTNQPYHGTTWLPTFSHRARIFWDLASRGWDTKLCNGGMIWNPRLLPYKNAITNELFIAASVSMYFNFPGDDNESPFSDHPDNFNPSDPDSDISSGPRDARYLKAAVEGYRWLRNSNMTNEKGLIVDGFHISGYLDENNNNTRCDARDEMVFTYNQGVILTGQRGLWDATGAPSFLKDGHRLIQNVIKATGYDLKSDSPIEGLPELKAGVLPRWHGLGRLGIMEEDCDASATCSQDGQTFKGIFFHHLTAFCAPLETPPAELGLRVHEGAFTQISRSHADACKSYRGWLCHNVLAALETRDASGRFGQWWTAGTWTGAWPTRADDGIPDVPNATDYRNSGVPDNAVWRSSASMLAPTQTPRIYGARKDQIPLGGDAEQTPLGTVRRRQHHAKDPNDRGRGRTVETQSGGLGLLRAYWHISRIP
ncbi:glycosyl hydrolase family 76-domain-containing protein [Xylaria bambusicola]|uniref:glycosyl hydrolase family 76-domain-containing protein n=1 Tax=Xylaria bambusicola TaxID=326684 RepID=UPI002007394C|nr:glycosyl hydrolase family 76-domain-containing protein [Xylaria bambusicola]KAI0505666.1 glycosyl hydrolase family 76-domain-containing protein [Xylaria bambusicola]